MSLLLIRHGETALNAARVLQPVATPLSERGSRQADALAQRVASLAPVAMVSSPLVRAWQTARAIAAATGLTIAPLASLAERDFGAWRGRPYDALGAGALTARAAPPGGEAMDAFEARVGEALDTIVGLASTQGGPIVVVTHGLVIGTLLARHLALARGARLPQRIANASITIAHATAPHEVTLMACTAHLTGALRDDAASLSGG